MAKGPSTAGVLYHNSSTECQQACHTAASENENTALKQKISGFEEKDERREREVKLMTRNLQDA